MRPTEPQPVPLARGVAPKRILDRVGAVSGGRPGVVAICGPVACGKTTLARSLGGTQLSTDDYLPDYSLVEPSQRDLPEHAHLDELAAHLGELIAGRDVRTPVWSFHEHRRTGERVTRAGDTIVVEGIHALHALVRGVVDVGVFMDAPAAIRLERFLDRERSGERGWTVEHAAWFFEHVAEPTFATRRQEYRAAAHYEVPGYEAPPPGATG